MIYNNDTFQIAPGMYAQFIHTPGDPDRMAWRLMDRFGRGVLLPEEGIATLCALLSDTPKSVSDRADAFSLLAVDGCDVGTVTGIEPAV